MSLLQTLRFSLRTARLAEVPRWKPARVERVASRRLRRLLNVAVARSPYYQKLYQGIDLDRASLAQLPPTNKAELMRNFETTVTDRRLTRNGVEQFIADPNNIGRWFLGRYAVSHTSGSQGQPMLIVQDRRCLEILFGVMSARANAMGAPGIFEGLRRLRSPARLAIIAQRRGFYPSGAAFEFMREMVGPFVRILWLSSMQTDLIQQLNEFQPNLLTAYACMLEALALQSYKLHLNDLRQIANSSEQLTARARERVAAAFRVPVLDHYGMGECLLLSDGCPCGGAHVNADWAILEVVDENYRPVRPGETGKKILVTNLANTTQPFIRYEVGDQVAMATEPCDCGSRLPRIARVEGRAAELFWVKRPQGFGALPGVVFHTTVDSLNDVREWQAVQIERNRIELRLEFLPGHDWPREKLDRVVKNHLRDSGMPDNVSIDVRAVSTLAPDAKTGKLRRMISEIGPPPEMTN